ncbi:MAG: hypothetical protein N3A55_07115 [Methylohalobius sp.]|nr:hypothetical protein [Methylohalobius sp.]
MISCVGWDVGGAHVKATLVQDRRIKAVWQVPCPLWRGLANLDQAMGLVLAKLPQGCVHGLTMTAEMVDLFDDRVSGVHTLLTAFSGKLGAAKIFLFVDNEFIPLSVFIKLKKAKKIASNNWQLTARFLAQKESKSSLCLDIGSTTTDLIPLHRGKPIYQGDDDHSRLRSGELLYTGVIRTPLAAFAKTVPFNGKWLPLMAEHFATTGDVYRILDRLPQYADQAETADGKPKTKRASMQRLARMIGLDRHAASSSAWFKLAQYFQEIQLQSFTRASLCQLSRIASDPVLIIGAGVGRFLAVAVAERLGLRYRDFGEYFVSDVGQTNFTAADCAPSAALACLLHAYLENTEA